MSSVESPSIEHGLTIGADLHRFLVDEALPGSGTDAETFFAGLAELVEEFAPRNAELLDIRSSMQAAIDSWHRDPANTPMEPAAYRGFLEDLGYLVAEGPDFSIETSGVDSEISSTPGPQLVVPVTNARYALNAANARWGSLYDAVYGTDVLGDLAAPGPYDPTRGSRVIDWARTFLDQAVPLIDGSHHAATSYRVSDGALIVGLDGSSDTTLAEPQQLVGFSGEAEVPNAILLEHHGLGIEIQIDRSHAVGATDPAGVSDIVLESAVTAIIDCEDSVAAVDSADKTLAYRNWLGLMKGDLTEDVTKDGMTFTRRLAENRTYTSPAGTTITRPGRSLLLTRNVGHLMKTPAVLDVDGKPIPEGLLDALVTVLCAKHDLARDGGNSRTGAVYIVKPKMHGPDEVAFTVDVFAKSRPSWSYRPLP